MQISKFKSIIIAVALMMAVGFLAGCARGQSTSTQQNMERIDPATLKGEVEGWFKQNAQKAGTYTMNSGGRTYVLVSWGQKPTGGYTVRIEDVGAGTSGMVAAVRLESPRAGDSVTQAITYPRDLVALPATNRAVAFAFLGREAESILTKQAAPSGGTTKTTPPEAKPGKPVAESDNFKVFEPAPGATVQSPLRVRGQARVFEGAFSLELEDGHNILAKANVQASAGGPEFGDFDVQLRFDAPTSPNGTLLFIVYSAKDGSRQEELAVPVKFSSFTTPGR